MSHYIFQEITEDYRKVFGNDLESIILYGSGASGDYIPKKSDLNLLIVLSEEGIVNLDKAFTAVSKWKKRNVAIPLFLTKDYIASSLDSFPIEFLNMKLNYLLVFGEDVLSDLSFEKSYLRIQAERELKGKLLQLRQGYMDTSHRKRDIQILIARSISTFIAIFKAILYLKDMEVSSHKDQIVSSICEEFNLDHELFSSILNIKDKKKKVSKKEMDSLMYRYISQIRHLSSAVDTMES